VEQYLSALSKRQTMLLLTALTYGGQESVADFDFLPSEEGEILKHRAQEILQIPRDKRIPMLVNEIKRLVTARRGSLWTTDPDKLAAVLQGERPALVEVVFKALPAGLTEEVRKRLPKMRSRPGRDVRPEVLNIVRWKLEEVLARRASGGRAGFKFSDMLLLKSRELITVIDRMGARALARALAGLPIPERESFLTQLSPDQRQLAQKAIAAGEASRIGEAEAREYLVRYDSLKGSAVALRNAGTQRVARACVAQSPEFAARMVERHPGELGRLLTKWIRHERPKISEKGDYGRADIVEQLERLAAKGVIDRPVRLPPPPRQELAARPPAGPPGGLPGGKVLLPPPRGGRPPLPGTRDVAPERPRGPGHNQMMAAREARRAGMAVPMGRSGGDTGELPRDASSGQRPALPRPPAPQPRPLPAARAGINRAVSAPVMTKPPVLKSRPNSPQAGQGTALQRSPRIVDGRTGSRQGMPKRPKDR
jgi:hypothetical protein